MELEEIEELKDFTIDITDIDELALGLEVCSKKSNMVIQEFDNLIIELEQQNKKYKKRCELAIDKIQLLIDLGFDYDGFNQVDSLKGLIDELVSLARESRNILKGSDSNDKRRNRKIIR